MNEYVPRFRTYWWLCVALAVNEGLSFLGYLQPALGRLLFGGIVVGTAIISWRSIEAGLLILLAELFVGGKGYLFSLTVGPGRVSIRLALFVVVLGVWLIRFSSQRSNWPVIPGRVRPWLYGLLASISLGIILGLARGNGFTAVFFDVNAYLFFALVAVLLSPVINVRRLIPNILALVAAAATILGLKSLLTLGLFVQLQIDGLRTLYKWIRDTGIGEVAPIFGGTYRVFFQSQIYGLLGVSLLVPFVLPAIRPTPNPRWLFIPITLGVAAVLVSLSRSFWLGGGVAAVSLLVLGWRQLRWSVAQAVRIVLASFAVVAVAYTLNSWALNFPYPFPLPGSGGQGTILRQRLTEFGGEAAATSRITLFKALIPVIGRQPIIGSGFGTVVTYRSDDPRQQQSPSRGIYTTDAFELGYLDMAVKIGLLGVAFFLVLLSRMLAMLLQRLDPLSLGFAVGLIALATVHLTTPYLNHPLGIGFLLLALTVAAWRNRTTA
ncbi:MAG: O-antigen ligase family protein [Candidatus Kerfeldbacteria bacterium]|nr:O-antigen ligase family protein [Candidatus Kerfeldbacteria bacterium]